jgi:hypothetical protein
MTSGLADPTKMDPFLRWGHHNTDSITPSDRVILIVMLVRDLLFIVAPNHFPRALSSEDLRLLSVRR